MTVVSGSLRDLVGASMANRQGVLVFRPNEAMVQSATTTPGTIHATAEVRVTPSSNGSFSVNLTATTVMLNDCYYTLRIEWVDGAGGQMDFPDWQIRVPVGSGGHIGNYITLGPPNGGWGGSLPNLSLVLMSLTFPDNLQRGQHWWKTDPDDPQNYNGRNTGEIYRGV